MDLIDFLNCLWQNSEVGRNTVKNYQRKFASNWNWSLHLSNSWSKLCVTIILILELENLSRVPNQFRFYIVNRDHPSNKPAGLKSTKLVMASFSVANVGVQGVLGPAPAREPATLPGPPPIVREWERSLACSPILNVSRPDNVLQKDKSNSVKLKQQEKKLS